MTFGFMYLYRLRRTRTTTTMLRRLSVKACDSSALANVASALRDAKSVLCITGAGMSADSGMPTYRGVSGLYNRETDDGVPIEVALSGETFRRNPELCWKYIRELEVACRDATPNIGHEVLARWEHRFDRFWILTQNIDSFHRRAGNKNVIEIHGHVESLQCTVCDWSAPSPQTTSADDNEWKIPTCDSCGAIARPPVILFGEQLRSSDVEVYGREIEYGAPFDVVLSIGTTSVFPYIAAPFVRAREQRRVGLTSTLAVEINPGTTDVSALADYRIQMNAANALASLDASL